MKKIAGFIDGYNLYNGMLLTHRPWLWVNLWHLVELIGPSDGTYVDSVTYYTAPTMAGASRQHQIDFERANREVNPGLTIVQGKMQPRDRDCDCDASRAKPQMYQEKQTDVNLALGLALGAVSDPPAYDIAVLITGDSDQIPAIKVAQSAGRTVVVGFPPNRHLTELEQLSSTSANISNAQIRKAQMSNVVVSKGYEIHRPNWGHRPGVDPPQGAPAAP